MSNLTTDQFGERLSILLKTHKMNQSEFSKKVHVSQSFVSSLIKGTKKPGMEFITRVKEHFNISVDWLLYGEGDKSGKSLIQIELLKAIGLRIELAKAALSGDEQAKLKILSIYPQLEENITGDFNFTYVIDNTQLIKDFSLLSQLYNELVDEELDNELYEKILVNVIKILSEKASDPLLST